MANDNSAKDPLEFVRGMWNNMGFSLPGMITPTLDVGELDKRIADLKAVENWLKMNLSMLQMTTQGLEVQRAAIAAVQAMSQQTRESGAQGPGEAQPNPFASAAMWPWAAMTGASAGGTPAGAANPASAAAGGVSGHGARKSAAEKK
ncbi:PhaM family polyhydroxyalkanoate granule multifunctional regulatory protein [Aromatoleum petrolei]|uniref:Regulatory protein n=1 Tax=Aromatoleum petrolei TaxID=76116 RepID=A0ABX1MS37_9RHOO|nr:PhaM family polyhydroxyalkanoate granule multifunctional regulatory protein [Aromatoleum petrolei]NMF90040.1 hypothetical protein [Aromatoleum petrolei]QTQ36141.1 Uncharacterized protein ToN1_19910 [Aromatoleum petrolei]